MEVEIALIPYITSQGAASHLCTILENQIPGSIIPIPPKRIRISISSSSFFHILQSDSQQTMATFDTMWWRQTVPNEMLGLADMQSHLKVFSPLSETTQRLGIKEKTSLSSLYGGCLRSVNNVGNASDRQLETNLRVEQS